MGNLTLLDGSQVKVVIKEAVDADANAYRLKPRELANALALMKRAAKGASEPATTRAPVAKRAPPAVPRGKPGPTKT